MVTTSIPYGNNFYSVFAAGCALVDIWEAVLIGVVGGFLANATDPLMVWFRIDDAVGATCVHGFCGVWGLLSVGIFSRRFPHEDGYSRYDGLLHGGGAYLLVVQTLASLVLIAWAASVTFILLYVRDFLLTHRRTLHLLLMNIFIPFICLSNCLIASLG